MPSKYGAILAGALLVALPACSENEFGAGGDSQFASGTGGGGGKSGADARGDQSSETNPEGSHGGGGGSGDDLVTESVSGGGDGASGDGKLGEGGDGKDGEGEDLEIDQETIHKPRICDETQIKFVGRNGKCPNDPYPYAAYSLDDADFPRFGCCPLPAQDILTDDPMQMRAGTCGANEVITGAAGGQSVWCSKINTDRYKLVNSHPTCYDGDGASGGAGAEDCGAPPATAKALVGQFGSDACLGLPFGSLITGRTGDDCRDGSAAELYYKEEDQPVKMYK